MKTLYVLRHAKSDWSDATLADFDRPLNHRGHKAAKAIGNAMRERGIEPDLVLASPSVRTQETLARVQHAFGEQFRVVNEKRIYQAHREMLAELVREAPDDARKLMIVGHNPGLHELVVIMTEPSTLREEAAAKFPTGALAEIHFPVDRWSDVAPGTGRLEALIRPREL